MDNLIQGNINNWRRITGKYDYINYCLSNYCGEVIQDLPLNKGSGLIGLFSRILSSEYLKMGNFHEVSIILIPNLIKNKAKIKYYLWI